MNPTEYARLNTVCDILDENGFTYKCYDVEDNTFNVYAEFYNTRHVNYFGAERFTELFAQYLKDNYELPDRREDSRCSAVWYGPYDAIKEQITKFYTYKQMSRPVPAVEAIADEGITISWNMQDKAEGYVIYRNTSEGGRYETLKKIKDPTVVEFTDTDVEFGTDYYYMIRAYRKMNGNLVYSRYSEAISTK